MRNLCILLFSCLMACAYAVEPTTVYLYSDAKPNGNGYAPTDEYTGNFGEIYQTSEPRIDLYLPKNAGNAPLLLVCPGGGYRYTSVINEGLNVADFFVPRGIAVAVLKYRVPNQHADIPLTDAVRAMQLLRSNASQWNINPRKMGVMGFSAGGHLAAMLLTQYGTAEARPDFGILVYPVISMDALITHAGTCRMLLGDHPTAEERAAWSAENWVTADTPPCFLVACQDDRAVPVENSIRFYQALTANKVTSEMLLLPAGGHGWGFARHFPQRELFETALLNFLSAR